MLTEDDIKSDIEVQFFEERVSKKYMFSGFLKDHNAQVDYPKTPILCFLDPQKLSKRI
jgi:hypothetical protein